jgi:cytochrome c-type biogenesis protein CcmE
LKRNNTKTRIILTIGAVLCAALTVLLLKQYISPYVTFSKARQSAYQVQIIGKPSKERKSWSDNQGCTYISLKDYYNSSDTLTVVYCKAVPENIDHSENIVSVGRYDEKRRLFIAQKLLYKCPSKYENLEKNKKISSF